MLISSYLLISLYMFTHRLTSALLIKNYSAFQGMQLTGSLCFLPVLRVNPSDKIGSPTSSPLLRLRTPADIVYSVFGDKLGKYTANSLTLTLKLWIPEFTIT